MSRTLWGGPKQLQVSSPVPDLEKRPRKSQLWEEGRAEPPGLGGNAFQILSEVESQSETRAAQSLRDTGHWCPCRLQLEASFKSRCLACWAASVPKCPLLSNGDENSTRKRPGWPKRSPCLRASVASGAECVPGTLRASAVLCGRAGTAGSGVLASSPPSSVTWALFGPSAPQFLPLLRFCNQQKTVVRIK